MPKIGQSRALMRKVTGRGLTICAISLIAAWGSVASVSEGEQTDALISHHDTPDELITQLRRAIAQHDIKAIEHVKTQLIPSDDEIVGALVSAADGSPELYPYAVDMALRSSGTRGARLLQDAAFTTSSENLRLRCFTWLAEHMVSVNLDDNALSIVRTTIVSGYIWSARHAATVLCNATNVPAPIKLKCLLTRLATEGAAPRTTIHGSPVSNYGYLAGGFLGAIRLAGPPMSNALVACESLPASELDSTTRTWVKVARGWLGDRQSTTDLMTIAKSVDQDIDLRYYAIVALPSVAGQQCRPLLERVLKDALTASS